MKLLETSLGIDFRKDHLVLTLLRKSFGKIRLAGYGIHPLSSQILREDREAQMISLINTFMSKHQVDKEKVSIAIPREKVVVRFIPLPVATKENLRKVLEYETPKYTPFEKGDVYFDYHILKEEKEWLHLFAVFVKKEEVDPYLSLLKKIGIEPISIQIPSTGALNLFFHNEGTKGDEVSVLLDVTEPFFEMNLIQGKDWKESFHLPLPKAGKASRIMSTLKHSGQDVHSYTKSTVFVYGLDADETMLTNLKETDQIKGVLNPPLNRLEVENGELEPYKIYSSIGIPLKGLTNTRMDLNLLPSEMRKKVRQIGKPLFAILAFVALGLSLTWGAGVFTRYRNELDSINAEIKKIKPEVEAVEKLQKRKEELGKEISELKKIEMGEVGMIEILQELTQLLPTTAWIWNLKYNGKEIEISGFSDSAANLIPLLNNSPFFEKVEFLAPVTKERVMSGVEGKDKERFKIRAKLRPRKVGS
jgi:general secretion pathway protein L